MKIGFVDYYMSEWHANNYPNWIADAAKELGMEVSVAYAWAELDVSPRDNVTTDEWCAKFGAQRCATLEELCEKSDAILILAPSDPQVHLAYAKVVLPYGKPTYIDKTFAPNAAVAAEIFALANQYGTPVFSTSALRYATELADFAHATDIIITGGGRSFEEYSIHQVEMAVMLLGETLPQVQIVAQGEQRFCHLSTADSRHLTIVYTPELPFTLTAPGKYTPIRSAYFPTLLAEILRFYDTRVAPVTKEQTMAVMALRDAVLGE